MTRPVALLIAISALVGCATSRSRDPIPPVVWEDDREALQIIARRAEQVRTVSATGLMTMRRPDGESVRFDIALVSEGSDRLRLRAWKLGRAVFDLTMHADGVWMLLPEDPSIRKRMREGQVSVAKIAESWSLFSGRFFSEPGLMVRENGSDLECVGTIDGMKVRCKIAKRTLTPRQYMLQDADGVERFSLRLSEYRMIGDVPFPRRYVARSEMGEILIALDEIEINTEPAAGAFVPPRRAEKLK